MQTLYICALLILLSQLWLHRSEPIGASNAFLIIILVFHGPAMFFFTTVWGGSFGFGQLQYLISSISSPEIIPRVYLAMTICIFCILIGIKLFNLTHNHVIWDHSSVGVGRSAIYRLEILLLAVKISALVICLFLLVQFLLTAPPTALVRYYFSNIDEFEKVDIRRNSALSFYPYQILLTAFFPFLALVLVAEYYSGAHVGTTLKRVRQHVTWFICIVLFAKLSQFNKSGPVVFISQIGFVIAYARTRSFRLTAWHFKAFFVGLILIIAMTFLVNSTDSLILTMLSAFDRTFMIPNEVIFEYFAAIPENLAHGYGTGLSWIAALSGKTTGASTLGTYWEVAAVVRGDYGSTSNAFFLADAWAEFSWGGIIALSLAAGWLVRWHDSQVAKWGHSPIAIALLVSGYNGAYTLGTTSITTAMLTGGLVLTPFIVQLMFGRHRVDKPSRLT